MENKMKRFLSLALVLVMVIALFPASVLAVETASVDAVNVLYLKPDDTWKSYGARFAAYFFGEGGDTWVSMTNVDNNYYSVEVPAGYSSVIFVRMNPDTTNNSWDDTWGAQTQDLSVSDANGNCFVITDPWNSSNAGYWDCAPTFETTVLYFKNTQNWTTINAYIWNKDTGDYIAQWPGNAELVTYVEDDIWSATIPAGYHCIIFNNGNEQTADLSITTAPTDLYDGSNWISQTAATVDGTPYTTLTAALSAAQNGQTVKAEKAVSLNSLVVNSGSTLDLNGQLLTAANVNSFGNVVDAAGNGGIVAGEGAAVFLQPTNSTMPIYDTEAGCYRFFSYQVKSIVATDAKIPNGVRFWFQITFDNVEAYNLLATTGNSHAALKIGLNWTGLTENVSCTITDENLKTYAATAYSQMQSKGEVTCGIYVTVFGLDVLESDNVVEATPTLSSDTMVEGSGDTLTYTKP